MPQTCSGFNNCAGMGKGAPCCDCFNTYVTGAGARIQYGTGTTAVDEPVVCGPTDKPGTLAQSCIGLTLVGTFGDACRAACKGDADCVTKARAYCAATATSNNFDCSCLSPVGKTWATSGSSTSSYNTLKSWIDKNSLPFNTQCAWPACSAGRAQSILQDPSMNCPPASLQCSVGNFSITLKDIQSSDVDLVNQNCGSIASGGFTRQGKTGKIAGWTQTQFAAMVAVLLVCVVALVVTVIVWWRARRGRKGLAKAAAAASFAAPKSYA